MHCSSCEPQLDRYVEGTLPPGRMRSIAAHLSGCARCEALHRELRVVDALLATAAPIEPAPNFTFAVMAATRTMHPPHRARAQIWALLGGYVAGTWVALWLAAVALGLRFSPAPQARAVALPAQHAFTTILAAVQPVAPFLPWIALSILAILIVDLTLFAGILHFYRNLRPRLAAHLAGSSEAP